MTECLPVSNICDNKCDCDDCKDDNTYSCPTSTASQMSTPTSTRYVPCEYGPWSNECDENCDAMLQTRDLITGDLEVCNDVEREADCGYEDLEYCDNACDYKNDTYRPGDSVEEDCNTCYCVDGTMSCTDYECAQCEFDENIDYCDACEYQDSNECNNDCYCEEGTFINDEGQCVGLADCPYKCIENGIVYRNGESWPSVGDRGNQSEPQQPGQSLDNCAEHVCVNGEIIEERQTCDSPLTCNENEKLVVLDGECCPTCQPEEPPCTLEKPPPTRVEVQGCVKENVEISYCAGTCGLMGGGMQSNYISINDDGSVEVVSACQCCTGLSEQREHQLTCPDGSLKTISIPYFTQCSCEQCGL
jgi:hypothetical protein